MAELGLTATELGALGYLPLEPGALRARLAEFGLQLVGGFVPLVLHEPDASEARATAETIAKTLSDAGAGVFVAAAVMDAGWSPPTTPTDEQLETMAANLADVAASVARHGLTFALHPHAGTLLESAADAERLLAIADVGWCLDTGHWQLGGGDPAAFVRDHHDRIAHVHLKDVDAAVAARYRAGELTLMGAVQAGLFRPLGQGDAGIAEVLAALDAHGYERWLVLEQDAAITGPEPPVGSGPLLDVRASIEFISETAPRRERVVR
jgi:inosose dehydratase